MLLITHFLCAGKLSIPAFPKSLKSNSLGRNHMQHLCLVLEGKGEWQKACPSTQTNWSPAPASFTFWEGTWRYLDPILPCRGKWSWLLPWKVLLTCPSEVWWPLWHKECVAASLAALCFSVCDGKFLILPHLQNCLLLPEHRACRDAPLKSNSPKDAHRGTRILRIEIFFFLVLIFPSWWKRPATKEHDQRLSLVTGMREERSSLKIQLAKDWTIIYGLK